MLSLPRSIDEKQFRIENGLLWPANDVLCARAVFSTSPDLLMAYSVCKQFRGVVQAGGNCGVWPRALAKKFDVVYTYEPDADNFVCLSVNTAHLDNVIRMQAALGEHHELVDLVRSNPANCGAYHVNPDAVGIVPVVRIDDLAIDACDLIVLDIEGGELVALKGAANTIGFHRPVIMLEDKGLSERYGIAKGDATTWLANQFGYRLVGAVHRDIVLAPA